jgi:hypothetical protein
MHRIEPAEPMDKTDLLDPMLSSEPAELSAFLLLGFLAPWLPVRLP